MSLVRMMIPLVVGMTIAATLNGSAAGIAVRSNAVMQGSDTMLVCDTTGLNAQWFVAEDNPSFVESVTISGVDNKCDGGTLYVFTNVANAETFPIVIPVTSATRFDVPIGQSVKDITSLSVVLLAPGSY